MTRRCLKADARSLAQVEFIDYLHHLFGYPFGAILAQQCGLTSEGLDVSHDPEVAAFFSIFDFVSGSFMEGGEGVIYRIAVPEKQQGNGDFRTASFYDCRSVISAAVTFRRLRRCPDWDAALATFLDYERHWMPRTGGNATPYPLERLGLPENDLARCRVIQQLAALVLPDIVLSRDYGQLTRQPPFGKAEWDGALMVEDIATRDGVDVFEFRHHPRNKYVVPRSPQILLPHDDAVTRLLEYYLAINPQHFTMTEVGIAGCPHPGLIS